MCSTRPLSNMLRAFCRQTHRIVRSLRTTICPGVSTLPLLSVFRSCRLGHLHSNIRGRNDRMSHVLHSIFHPASMFDPRTIRAIPRPPLLCVLGLVPSGLLPFLFLHLPPDRRAPGIATANVEASNQPSKPVV